VADDKNISFMRSLCFGEIAEDILFPFPKIQPTERELLTQMIDSFSSWLKGRDAEFRKWDVAGDLPASFIQEMRDFGLFSLIIPESHGGLGMSSTGYSRTLQELVRYDASIALTAGAHSSIGMRGLILFGNDEQKQRYLPKLATGERIAAFCLTESEAGSDAAAIKTRAVKDGDDWILNGEKIWITNGGIADFFTVFARTDSGKKGQMTAFIVTRDMPGVSNGPHEDKMGIRASSTTSVFFKDVRLKPEQILGEEGKGFKVAMRVLNSGRTGLGGGCIGGMKRIIELSTKQAKERKQFGKPIAEFGLIKQKLGHMVVECYATEAVVAMVAGIIDSGHDDYAVEAAISKVFASECMWRTVDEGLQIAAGMGYMREAPYEKLLRDARINRIFEGTNEILRLFIALTAMNDVGQDLKEISKSLGNVLVDPIKGFGLLTDYTKRRVSQATGIGAATLSKAHPDLRTYCTTFEESTVSLASAVDRLLRKHGKDIINKQFAIKRLADIMIDLFVLASVISRVSASITEKGQEDAAREVDILEVFSGQVQRRVRSNIGKIDDNDDELIKALAEHAFAAERFVWDNI
jgi:alkylation response protein AidB-like acyl-CoA dehydrogenase